MKINFPCGDRVSALPREMIFAVEGPELGSEPHAVSKRLREMERYALFI